MLRPIYYDTETTGIAMQQERIIEIAAYDPVQDRQFCSFIHPERPIPPEATQIHHITDEMVATAPLFAEVYKQFVAFCSGEVVLIAHNNDAFDKPFLEAECKKTGQQLPACWKWADSLKWARRYRPDLPKHNLQFLREMYNIPANQAHRALDDVIVLWKVFSSMIGDLSMEHVLELLEQPQKIDRMPFGKYRGQPLSALPQNYISWLSSSGLLDRNNDLKQALEKMGRVEKMAVRS